MINWLRKEIRFWRWRKNVMSEDGEMRQHLDRKINAIARYLQIPAHVFVDMVEDKEAHLQYSYEIARASAMKIGDPNLIALINDAKNLAENLDKDAENHFKDLTSKLDSMKDNARL